MVSVVFSPPGCQPHLWRGSFKPKAGLLLLEAKSSETSSDLGFFALAIIAGLNVDKFVSKVEDIAQATWGIERSRTAKGENDNAS